MTTGTIPPWAVYVAAVGAGASGVTGMANNASLGRLYDVSREEVRVAEVRGRMESEISVMKLEIARMMPREDILELHRSHQMLLERLIDFTSSAEKKFATKSELELVVRKIEGRAP